MAAQRGSSFKLIPEKVPPRGARAGLYDRIVTDFLAKNVDSARVVVEGRKPASIRLSLKKAVDRSGGKLRVVARGDDTYLTRK